MHNKLNFLPKVFCHPLVFACMSGKPVCQFHSLTAQPDADADADAAANQQSTLRCGL